MVFPSVLKTLIKRRAIRSARRQQLGDKCSICAKEAHSRKLLRRSRYGSRYRRQYVTVSQLEGHHLVPVSLTSTADYIGRATELLPVSTDKQQSGQHLAPVTELRLLCRDCHTKLHSDKTIMMWVIKLLCISLP
jgi:predicted HNH restriction endonuclease